MTLAADYPLANLFWTFVCFFALMIYFWLLITVFTDLFRRDLSGWLKTAWAVFVIVLPGIGSLTYLITQGRSMADRESTRAQAARQQTDAYIRSVVPAQQSHGVDEIARAKQLLDSGALSQEEFDQLKRRVLV
jgi:thiosulfate reductase cytochrome b subunit